MEDWEPNGNENTPVEEEYRPEPADEPTPDAPAASEPEDTAPAEPAGAPESPAEAPQARDDAYRNLGAGRRESPFADSPYVMYHAPAPYTAPAEQPAAKKTRKKSGKKIWMSVCAAALVVVLIAASCGITAWGINNYWEGRSSELMNTMNQRIRELERKVEGTGSTGSTGGSSSIPVASGSGLTPSQVYAQNVNSTVFIYNEMSSYYGQAVSTGSGFIYSDDGYIISNYHVVENASRLTVITEDGTEYDASVVGYDETNDLAVLKIDATGLPAVTIGSSDELMIGDQVVAIGNPLGELTSTMTVGYVSGKDRVVTTDNTTINMLQTDAAINPGNSGGPLFNMRGEVVGITSAKYSGTTTSGASIEGIGFAIPIDDVRSMIEDIINYGYVTGAYLGVSVSDMDASVAQRYNLPMGAYVESVEEGGCAADAGLRQGDIILELGGYDVDSVTGLRRALRHFDAGETVSVTIYRGGQETMLTLILDERPHDATVNPEDEMPTNGDYDAWREWYDRFYGNGN